MLFFVLFSPVEVSIFSFFVSSNSRSLSPTAGESNASLIRSGTNQISPYDTHSLSRRHLKSRVGVIDDDSSKVIMFYMLYYSSYP